jgi:ferrous iron transport protein A
MTLDEVKSGTQVKIVDVAESSMKTRLMSMGLIKGTTVRVMSAAPLGDPISIQVRSYKLALRKADAKNITVSI